MQGLEATSELINEAPHYPELLAAVLVGRGLGLEYPGEGIRGKLGLLRKELLWLGLNPRVEKAAGDLAQGRKEKMDKQRLRATELFPSTKPHRYDVVCVTDGNRFTVVDYPTRTPANAMCAELNAHSTSARLGLMHHVEEVSL